MFVLQKLSVYCRRREKTKFNDTKMTLKMWIISVLLSDKKKKIVYVFYWSVYPGLIGKFNYISTRLSQNKRKAEHIFTRFGSCQISQIATHFSGYDKESGSLTLQDFVVVTFDNHHALTQES